MLLKIMNAKQIFEIQTIIVLCAAFSIRSRSQIIAFFIFCHLKGYSAILIRDTGHSLQPTFVVFCDAYTSVALLYVCLLLNSCCVMLTMFYLVKF